MARKILDIIEAEIKRLPPIGSQNAAGDSMSLEKPSCAKSIPAMRSTFARLSQSGTSCKDGDT